MLSLYIICLALVGLTLLFVFLPHPIVNKYPIVECFSSFMSIPSLASRAACWKVSQAVVPLLQGIRDQRNSAINRSDRTRNEYAEQLVPYGCRRGCGDSVNRHVVSRYFENWRITRYHVVEILTLHGPKRDPYLSGVFRRSTI